MEINDFKKFFTSYLGPRDKRTRAYICGLKLPNENQSSIMKKSIKD